MKKPAAPSAITASSSATVSVISRDFSYLSASWPGGGGEQEERQDEQRLREVLQRVRRHRGEGRRLVGEQDDERLLEDVVVHRAEELDAEERPEAPLGQQAELAALSQWPQLPKCS